MSSAARIPKAEITGLYGYAMKRFSRKMFGEVPEPAEVMWHNRAVLTSLMGVGRKADKWIPLLKNRTPVVAAALQNTAGIVGAAMAADVDVTATGK